MKNFKGVEVLSEFDECFIKSYNEKSKEGYFLKVDIKCPENLPNVQNDLPFLVEAMKSEKFEKNGANLHNKNKYVIHMYVI